MTPLKYEGWIYRWRNRANGLCYHGQSSARSGTKEYNFESAVRRTHSIRLNWLRKGVPSSYATKMRADWEFYGEAWFEFEVVERGIWSREDLDAAEVKHIGGKVFPKSYNMAVGGSGAPGSHHSEEWKQELSRRNSGDGNHFFGKKHTDEAKRKIAEKRFGSGKRLNMNEIHRLRTETPLAWREIAAQEGNGLSLSQVRQRYNEWRSQQCHYRVHIRPHSPAACSSAAPGPKIHSAASSAYSIL